MPAAPVEVAPVAMPEMPAAPVEVAPVAMPEMPAAPVEVAPVAMPEMPAAPVEVAPVEATPAPVIYGGANPVVDVNFNQGPSNHQIYGGADPLENTQTIPTVEPQPVVPVITEPVMINSEASVTPVASAAQTPTIDVLPVEPVNQIQQ